MQNEFEKQVQQKMEELDCVPSAPVWQKIEAQIRKKKDRRRLFLWLPLLLLLLGGGIWWMNEGNTDDTASRTGAQQPHSINPAPDQPGRQQASTSASNLPPAVLPAGTGSSSLVEGAGNESNRMDKKTGSIFTVKTGAGRSSKEIDDKGEARSAKRNASLTSGATKQIRIQGSSISKGSTVDTAVERPLKKPADKGDSIARLIVKAEMSTASDSALLTGSKPAPVNDTVANTTTAPAAPAKNRPWQWGFTASAGVDGITNGLNLFGGQKRMDAQPSSLPSSPGTNNFNASPIENDLHFSLGFVLKKQLSKKVIFSTGIQYDYFSTKMLVGRRVDSSLSVTGDNSLFANQFSNGGAGQQTYHNQFHFISLPVELQFQLANQVPLFLQTGISLKQMIGTNALRYNYVAQLYKEDDAAFKKTEVFASLGLAYAFQLKNKTLVIGPQVQYALTRLEKEDATHRLASLGFRFQYFFQKK